jgi:hypothetical protein
MTLSDNEDEVLERCTHLLGERAGQEIREGFLEEGA